jgi:hypothetical protein
MNGWLVKGIKTVVRWIEDYIDQLSASIEQAEIEEERRM